VNERQVLSDFTGNKREFRKVHYQLPGSKSRGLKKQSARPDKKTGQDGTKVAKTIEKETITAGIKERPPEAGSGVAQCYDGQPDQFSGLRSDIKCRRAGAGMRHSGRAAVFV
jgi:hypothetical protein